MNSAKLNIIRSLNDIFNLKDHLTSNISDHVHKSIYDKIKDNLSFSILIQQELNNINTKNQNS